MDRVLLGVAAVLLSISMSWAAQTTLMTDGEIRRAIITDAIKTYTGECPCPYSRAADGSRCGDKSKRKEGEPPKPVCYPEDVPADVIDRYRATRL